MPASGKGRANDKGGARQRAMLSARHQRGGQSTMQWACTMRAHGGRGMSARRNAANGGAANQRAGASPAHDGMTTNDGMTTMDDDG